MRPLQQRPLVLTFIVSALICASIFGVQTWMTDMSGDVDGKAPITEPPTLPLLVI